MTSIAGSWIFVIHAWQILCVDLSYGNEADEQLYSGPNWRDWQWEEPDNSLRQINEGYFGTRELSYEIHNTHRNFRGLKEFFRGRMKGSKSSYGDEDESDTRPIVSTAPNPTVVQDQEEDNWYTRQKRKLLLQNYDSEQFPKEKQRTPADTMKNQPQLTTNSKQLKKPTASPDKLEEDWLKMRKRLWQMDSDETSESLTGNQKNPLSNNEKAKPNDRSNRPPTDDQKPAIPRIVVEQIPPKANDQENKQILDDNQKPQPMYDQTPIGGKQITLQDNAQMLPSVNDQKPLLANEKVSPTTKVDLQPSHVDDQNLLTGVDNNLLTLDNYKHFLKVDEKPQPIDDQKPPLLPVVIDQTPPSTDSIILPNANTQKPLLDKEKISPVKTVPDQKPSHVADQKLAPVDDSKLLTLEDNKLLLERDHTPTSIMDDQIQSSLENRGTAMKLDVSTQKQSTDPKTLPNPSIVNVNKDLSSPNKNTKRVAFIDLPDTNKQSATDGKSEKVAEESVDSTHDDDKTSQRSPELTEPKPFNSETNYPPKTTTKEMESNLVLNPKLDTSVDTANEETDELHKNEVDYIDKTSRNWQKETNEDESSNLFHGAYTHSTNDDIKPTDFDKQHSPLIDDQKLPLLSYIPTLSSSIGAKIKTQEHPEEEPVSDKISYSFAEDHTPSTNDDIKPKDFIKQHSPLLENQKSPLLNDIPTLSSYIGAETEAQEQPKISEDSLLQSEPIRDPMSNSFAGDHTPSTNDDIKLKDLDKQHSPLQDKEPRSSEDLIPQSEPVSNPMSNLLAGDRTHSTNDDIRPKDFNKQHSPLLENQKSPLLNDILTSPSYIGAEIEGHEQPKSSEDLIPQSELVSDPMSNLFAGDHTASTNNDIKLKDLDKQHSPLQDKEPSSSEDLIPQSEPVSDPMSNSFAGDHTPSTTNDIKLNDLDKQHSPLQDKEPSSSEDLIPQSEPVSNPMSNVKYESLTNPSTNTAQIHRGRPEGRRLSQRPRTLSGTADEPNKPVSDDLKREPPGRPNRLTSPLTEGSRSQSKSGRDPISMTNEQKKQTVHSINGPASDRAGPRARPLSTRSKEIDALAEDYKKPISNEVTRSPKAHTLSTLPPKEILKRALSINHPLPTAEKETRTTQYRNDKARTRPIPQARPNTPRPTTQGTHSPRSPTRLGEKTITSQNQENVNEDKGLPNRNTKRVAFDLPETKKQPDTNRKPEKVAEEKVDSTNNDDKTSQKFFELTDPKLTNSQTNYLPETTTKAMESNAVVNPKLYMSKEEAKEETDELDKNVAHFINKTKRKWQMETSEDEPSNSFAGDHRPATNDDIKPKDSDKQHSPLQVNQKSPLSNYNPTLLSSTVADIEAKQQPRISEDSLPQSKPISDPMSNVKYEPLTTPSTNTAQIHRGRPEGRRLPQRPRTLSGTADEPNKPVSDDLKRDPPGRPHRLTSPLTEGSRSKSKPGRDPISMANEKTPTVHSINGPASDISKPRARPLSTRSKEIDALAEDHNEPLSNEVTRSPKAHTLSPLPPKDIPKQALSINHPLPKAEKETSTTQHPNDVARTRPRPQASPLTPRPNTQGTYSPRRPTRLGEKSTTSQNQDNVNEDKGSPNRHTKRVAVDLPETNKQPNTDRKSDGVAEERVDSTNNDDLPSQKSFELTEPKSTNSKTNNIASPESEASIVLPHPRRKPDSQRLSNTNHSPGEPKKIDSDSSIVLPHPRRKPGASRGVDSNQSPTQAQSVPVSKLKVERTRLSHPLQGPTGFPQRKVPTKNAISPSSKKGKGSGFSSALKKIGNIFSHKKKNPNLANEISPSKPSSARPPKGPDRTDRTSDQSQPSPRRTLRPNNNGDGNEPITQGTIKPHGPGSTSLPARQSSGRYKPPVRKPQPSKPGGKTENEPPEKTSKAGSSNERGTPDRLRTGPSHAERPTDRPRNPPPINLKSSKDVSEADTSFSPEPRKPQSPVSARRELQKRPPSPHTPSRTSSEPEKEPENPTESSKSDTSFPPEPKKPHNPITARKEFVEIPHTPQITNSESRTSQESEKEPEHRNKLLEEDSSSSSEPRKPNSPVPAVKQAQNERHTLYQNPNSKSRTTGEPEKEPQRSNSFSEAHNDSPKLRKQPSQITEFQKRPRLPQRTPAKARTSPVPERMNSPDKQLDRTDEQPASRRLEQEIPKNKEKHKSKGFFSKIGTQLKGALKKSHSSKPTQPDGSSPMSRAENKELPLRQPSHQSPEKEKKKSGGFFSNLGRKMKKALSINSSKPNNPDSETNVLPKRPIQQNAPQPRESRKPQPTKSRPTGSQPTGSQPTGPRTPGPRTPGPRTPGPRPTGPRPTGPRPTGPRPTEPRTDSSRPADPQQTGGRTLKPRPTKTRPLGP